ncbi:nucleotide sugar dehydrogenase [Candidatus Pelagibacter communis]|uniref:nucleotide sugar dehydrogenase n=1 Tax=Pelagibacter ubique TaxID=198252 RepID=UPI00094C8AB6|nr:nucleotide sugar dehydrogenase [Candidatus Pelagibacter ubique]
MKINKISILGLGYIGLPLAVILADKSCKIYGFDKDQKVLENIKKLKIKIKEKDLLKKFKSQKVQKNFKASNKIIKSDVYILAVPTPFNKKVLKPDISAVKSAIYKIIHFLDAGNLIIIESTCPVGTTEIIKKIIYKKRNDLKKDSINISYCPERILPGNTLKELISNDRIIGGIDLKSSKHAEKVYKKFVKGSLNLTNSKTAEMCKLVENTYRDINIAYANELSIICEKLKIDVWNLIKLANLHPRVNILNPGPGVGGHCIAVDPWFLISRNPKISKLTLAARKVNDYKINWVINQIKRKIKEINLPKKNKNIKIGFFGATYKANSEDLRESPSLRIINYFLKKNEVKTYLVEPNIDRSKFKYLNLTNTKYLIKKSDIIVILVNHKEFKKLKLIKDKKVLDISGLLN